MDLKAEHLSEHVSDPVEFLRQLRQTTEPIGGGTEYREDGELVEYDVAVEAVKKANDAFIEKALEFLDGCIPDYVDLIHANVDTFMNVDNKRFIDEFRKYMKGE